MALIGKNKATGSGGFNVQIGRMGSGMETAKVKPGTTVDKLLDVNDFEVGPNESVYVNGTKIDKGKLSKTELSRGAAVAIVGAKEGGR